MAVIECNEIQQVGNELLIAFQNCKKIKNEDLVTLVELVLAVNNCTNGGPNYDTLVSENYSPLVNTIVNYPVDSFHSVSIMVLGGNIIKDDVTFPTGTVINYEFTSLNQTSIEFTVLAGAIVVVEYLIETI